MSGVRRRAVGAGATASVVALLGGCVPSSAVPVGYTWREVDPEWQAALEAWMDEGFGRDVADFPQEGRWAAGSLTLQKGGVGSATALPVWSGEGTCGVDGMGLFDGDVTWSSRNVWNDVRRITIRAEGFRPVEAHPPAAGGPIADSAVWPGLVIGACGLDEQSQTFDEQVWTSWYSEDLDDDPDAWHP